MNSRYFTYSYHTLIGYRMYNQRGFSHHFRMSVSYPEAGMNMPMFSQLGIFLRLRRPHESSRPQHSAGPARVRSRQAITGTVAEEANEKVRLASRKGPRSAEGARISPP